MNSFNHSPVDAQGLPMVKWYPGRPTWFNKAANYCKAPLDRAQDHDLLTGRLMALCVALATLFGVLAVFLHYN
jgi:hypothetical protein